MTNLTSRPGRTRAITRRGWARTAVVGTAVALMSLGVGEKISLEDACRIEHVISAESFDAIKRFVTGKKE